jgi:hypothetical protein
MLKEFLKKERERERERERKKERKKERKRKKEGRQARGCFLSPLPLAVQRIGLRSHTSLSKHSTT